jgi:type III pantothenate kinase
MLLCLDIGNTHIFGGVFREETLVARFRCATHLLGTADQLGIFLVQILNARKIESEQIKAVAICSVVPSHDFTVRHALNAYFNVPLFMLQAGVKTGLNIRYKNAGEVGADRISNAIAAAAAFPDKNLMIIDMGTATTFCAVTKDRDYLGGAILPGLRLGMEALRTQTAKLMEVDIEVPAFYIGRSTRESIQSGLYFGQLGAFREMINGMQAEAFSGESMVVIGTGGFAQLYRDRKLFDAIMPDLVLQGLLRAYQLSLA